MSSMNTSNGNQAQCQTAGGQVAYGPLSGLGRDEKEAMRRANEAERRFRIKKGYEKDTLWTRLKYRFLKR